MDQLADLHAQLRGIACAQMHSDTAHDLAHLDRVWRNAQAICDDSTNFRVLIAACYLHDLVNLPKNHPERSRASQMSADAAMPLLQSFAYSEPELRAVHHAIVAHSFSANVPPETPEARFLRDADRLDALGAIGIARAFSVSGALARELYDPADPFASSRELDDTQFSIDHWRVKLLGLPRDMLTEGGARLAQERVQVNLAFLETFAQEIGSDLPAPWRDG